MSLLTREAYFNLNEYSKDEKTLLALSKKIKRRNRSSSTDYLYMPRRSSRMFLLNVMWIMQHSESFDLIIYVGR